MIINSLKILIRGNGKSSGPRNTAQNWSERFHVGSFSFKVIHVIVELDQ